MPDIDIPALTHTVLLSTFVLTFLFGAVSFETFGHLHGVVDDLDAWFDHEVHRVAAALGLR